MLLPVCTPASPAHTDAGMWPCASIPAPPLSFLLFLTQMWLLLPRIRPSLLLLWGFQGFAIRDELPGVGGTSKLLEGPRPWCCPWLSAVGSGWMLTACSLPGLPCTSLLCWSTYAVPLP